MPSVHAEIHPSSDVVGIAVVTEIFGEVPADYVGFSRTEQTAELRFQSGEYRGTSFMTKAGILNNREDMRLHVGDRFTIDRVTMPDGQHTFFLRERYRLTSLLWLLACFVGLGIVFGGIRGLSSILGLVVSIGILGWYVVPTIASGGDPFVTSLIGSYLIACSALYLAHGFSRRTSVALLSTCITLAIAAVFSVLAVEFCQLFGMGTEESAYLQTGSMQAINLRGLLIGGFIIGALGVLDDVTTAQTAAIDEMRRLHPAVTRDALWRSGMSVGREHIASLINTLALAYVGASLPIFLLFRESGGLPLWIVANSEAIVEEIVRTLIGSTALLLAVPISTWCAVRFLGEPSQDSSHHHHHHVHS